MDEWRDVPLFGTCPKGRKRILRPSAYALIRNDAGLIAIVRAPLGGVFLPGGGIDSGETPEQAVVREAGEECGLVVRVVELVGRAIQLAAAKNGSRCFEKRSVFFTAEMERMAPELQEPHHTTLWVTVEEAVRLLSHESQRDIAQRWKQV